MRKSIACLIVVIAATLTQPANGQAQLLPKDSLWGEAADTAAEDIPALCDRIVANQDRNRTGMIDAAYLYYSGKLMGQRCLKTDYVRSLDLFRKAGDQIGFKNTLRLLKNLATGSSGAALKAAKALKTADLTPF